MPVPAAPLNVDPVQVQLAALDANLEQLSALTLLPEAAARLQTARGCIQDLRASIAAGNAESAHLAQALDIANDARARFVSVVTHELRTPMTAIRGYTDLLLKGLVGPVTQPQADFLGIIRSNVDRMSDLVSDLADMSRLETGRLKLELAVVSLSDCINEAVRALQAKFDEKKQLLTLDFPSGDAMVWADPKRLIQILSYLLSNACKYTPSGGRIAVRAIQIDKSWLAQIADAGIGIELSDQSKIFTPFFRSEDPKVRQETGWGLSLHIAKSLVEAMNGEIGFTSAAGQGSTFWFTLPAQPAERT